MQVNNISLNIMFVQFLWLVRFIQICVDRKKKEKHWNDLEDLDLQIKKMHLYVKSHAILQLNIVISHHSYVHKWIQQRVDGLLFDFRTSSYTFTSMLIVQVSVPLSQAN